MLASSTISRLYKHLDICLDTYEKHKKLIHHNYYSSRYCSDSFISYSYTVLFAIPVHHPVARSSQHSIYIRAHLLIGQSVTGVTVLHIQTQCQHSAQVYNLQCARGMQLSLSKGYAL
jgi:hypothetical protein